MTITRDALSELLAVPLRPAVSILMPADASTDVRQEPIRLRNLLREVDAELAGRGLEPRETASITSPAHALVDDRGFWRFPERGLALYAAPNFFRVFRVARPLRELCLVEEQFYVNPLFPHVDDGGHFYVLALSQKDVRLIEATRSSAAEVDLRDLPRNLAEAVPTEPPGQELQHHVTRGAGGERGAMFHGHGAGNREHRKEAVRQFFHVIDRGLRPFLADRDAPLVLAGVKYLLPIYRETNSHPGLLTSAIAGNPETMSTDALAAEARALIGERLDLAEIAALDRYREMEGSGRVSSDFVTIVRACQEGRVDELFVADGAQQWGTFAPDSGAVVLRDSRGPASVELINLAAVEAFQRGAAVHVVDGARMPREARLAATFRY